MRPGCSRALHVPWPRRWRHADHRDVGSSPGLTAEERLGGPRARWGPPTGPPVSSAGHGETSRIPTRSSRGCRRWPRSSCRASGGRVHDRGRTHGGRRHRRDRRPIRFVPRASTPSTTTTAKPSNSGATAAPPSASTNGVSRPERHRRLRDGRRPGPGRRRSARTPPEVATGAAVGRAGQAPSRWLRPPTSSPTSGPTGRWSRFRWRVGSQTVIAADAATASIGKNPSIAWNSTGDSLAYLAVGTPGDGASHARRAARARRAGLTGSRSRRESSATS